MDKIRYLLAGIASTGFVLCIAILLVISLRGMVSPEIVDWDQTLPWARNLQFGAYFVALLWIATVVRQNIRGAKTHYYDTLLPSIKGAFYIVCGWMLISSILFFLSFLGETIDIREGQYNLQRFGAFTRTLTEPQYHQYMTLVLRGSLTFWGLLYLIGCPYWWYPKLHQRTGVRAAQ